MANDQMKLKMKQDEHIDVYLYREEQEDHRLFQDLMTMKPLVQSMYLKEVVGLSVHLSDS